MIFLYKQIHIPNPLKFIQPKFQILLMASLLSTLFGCFQKKEKKNDLPTWLETNFPGQLEVAGNIINVDLKNLYYKKKTSMVADKHDPEVQIVVNWYKAQPGLGVTKEEVQASLIKSRKEVAEGRSLFKALKEKDLGKFSVGVIEMAAYILIYEEPTPELRKDYLGKIMATLDAMPDHKQTSIWIEFMEPAVYQERFKDIVTLDYWNRGDTFHEDKKILSLDYEWSPGLEAEIMNTKWTINASSARSTGYREEAYKLALTWAQKNLPSPFYLEEVQMVGMGVDDEDPLSLEFDFPYYSSKPDSSVTDLDENLLGFVNGVYHTEKKTFTKVKKTTER